MTGIYKISEDKIIEMAKRETLKQTYFYIALMIIITFTPFIYFINNPVTGYISWIFLLFLVFYIIILLITYSSNLYFFKVYFSLYRIIVKEDMIHQKIDIGISVVANNFQQRIALASLPRYTSPSNKRIFFKRIRLIKELKNGLLVSGTFGYEKFIIPKEIENYNIIKEFLINILNNPASANL